MYLNTEDLSSGVTHGRVHFWAIAQGLLKLGCRVTIVAPRYRRQPILLPDGIGGCLVPVPLKNALSLLLFELLLLLIVPWIVCRYRPAIVLVRGGGPGWIPGLWFGCFRLFGVPVVLECNGVSWREFQSRGSSPLLVWMARVSAWQQARACTRLIAVTREIGEAYCRLAGRSPAAAVEIPNGVDPAAFLAAPERRNQARRERLIGADEVVVGYVGSFSVWHGIPEMLDAAAILLDRGCGKVVIVLVGSGDLLPEARRRQRMEGLANLRLPGASVNRAQLRDWMITFDVGLCTNLPFDGSPLKFFEYLACGIPVIGSGVPQVLRLIESEQSGIAMALPTGAAIADAIQHIVEERREWLKVGARNRALAAHAHSWDRVCADVLEVLTGTTAAPRRSNRRPVPDRLTGLTGRAEQALAAPADVRPNR
jgi:glycosyltransferase involved in cell wall biosynthesis